MSASVHGRGFDWWQASSMAFLASSGIRSRVTPRAPRVVGMPTSGKKFAQPRDKRRGGFGGRPLGTVDLHGDGKIAQAAFRDRAVEFQHVRQQNAIRGAMMQMGNTGKRMSEGVYSAQTLLKRHGAHHRRHHHVAARFQVASRPEPLAEDSEWPAWLPEAQWRRRGDGTRAPGRPPHCASARPGPCRR